MDAALVSSQTLTAGYLESGFTILPDGKKVLLSFYPDDSHPSVIIDIDGGATVELADVREGRTWQRLP